MKHLAFIFPGQGAQAVGMGKDLCDNFAIANTTFAEANEALGLDLQKLCFEGPTEELTKTEFAQPALLTHSIAAFRVLTAELGITPKFSAGHSLGEYSALVAAGALDFATAVKLVNKRGQYMQEAVPIGVGAMMAVMKLDLEKIDLVCAEVMASTGEVVNLANYNTPEQVVISGHKSAVEEAGKRLQELGATVKMLNVSAPFHCSLMKPAADRMLTELKQVTFKPLKWPVIANVTAQPYTNTSPFAEMLATQIASPVLWHSSVGFMVNAGITRAIEMGPGNVLKNMLKRSYPNISVLNLSEAAQLGELQTSLGLKRDLLMLVARSMGHAVSTRNRNFDNEAYQKGVIEPYQKIQQLQNRLEAAKTEPTLDEAREVLELLKTIFATKQVPEAEQLERFTELFEETGTVKDFADFELPSLCLA